MYCYTSLVCSTHTQTSNMQYLSLSALYLGVVTCHCTRQPLLCRLHTVCEKHFHIMNINVAVGIAAPPPNTTLVDVISRSLVQKRAFTLTSLVNVWGGGGGGGVGYFIFRSNEARPWQEEAEKPLQFCHILICNVCKRTLETWHLPLGQ